MAHNYVHCKYCPYKTVRFFKRKNGTLSGPGQAMERLKEHMARMHPRELKEMEELFNRANLTIPYGDPY